MSDLFDQTGFEDSILNSNDDYEPYGYVAPQLMPAGAGMVTERRNPIHHRIIEAELLSQCDSVGC
jgi:hypothetical protein